MDMERKVAASASDLLGAARDTQSKRSDLVEFCGQTVRIAPCRAADYYGIKRRAEQLEELAGKPYREQVENQLAWVAACVTEPRLEIADVVALSDAAPADFEKLASVCERASMGQPAPVWALGVLTAHVCGVYEQAEDGSLQRPIAEFWGVILGTVYQWLNSAEATTLPDFGALATALQGNDAGVEAAITAAREWSRSIEAEPKNASAALSMEDSSEPPSSGPTDTPENS